MQGCEELPAAKVKALSISHDEATGRYTLACDDCGGEIARSAGSLASVLGLVARVHLEEHRAEAERQRVAG